MAVPFRFDRTFAFAVDDAALWSVLSRTDEFPHWWSWLREYDSDRAGLVTGNVSQCTVQAPLPYALRFAVNVERVVPRRLVDTRVSGDLHGPARLEVAPTDHGCTARLAWSVELRDPVLRTLSRFARPAMEWAHDRIVAVGVRQFEHRALARPTTAR